MAEETGTGLSLKGNPFSFEPSPELQAINASQALKFAEENAPLAKAVTVMANPQSAPEDKLQAADAVKAVSNRSEFRLADFIDSVLRLNVRDAIISATGGTHNRVQAWDQDGNEYYKIFNQRITKQNPYGELVGYEDTKFRPVDPESIKNKVIVSNAEVPLTQRPFYEANRITAKEAATAQASNWVRLQNLQREISLATPEIKSLNMDNTRVLDFLKDKSVDPETRALLAGASEIRTGNAQSFKNSAEKIKKASNAKEFNEAKEEFKKNTGGVNLQVQWIEGKGKTDSSGNKVTDEELNQIISGSVSDMSSNNAITARKDDLLNRAQALKLKGDIQGFDALQQYINNEYKKGLLINKIQDLGGIGIATPNVPFQTGDSFSLAYVKNKSDEAYADLADHFANVVRERIRTGGNTPPGIGMIEAEISKNPIVTERKKQLYKDIGDFERSYKPIAEQISKQKPAPELMQQPGISITNQGSMSSARQPVAVEETKIPAARPPVATAKPEAKKTPRPLGAIF